MADDSNIEWIREEAPNDAQSTSPVVAIPRTGQSEVVSPQAKGAANDAAVSPFPIPVQLFNESDKENTNLNSSDEFDITDYEEKLRDNAEQTKYLIGNLCDRSEQITEQQKEALLRLEQEQRERQKVTEEMKKVTERNEQLSTAKQELEQRIVQLSAGRENSETNHGTKSENRLSQTEWKRIDSASIGENELSQPSSAAFLQNGDQIIVADQQNGLLLFSIQSGLIKKVHSPEWKWPQSAICTLDNKILVSVLAKSESEGKMEWKRNLMKFDENLECISRIEGPKWIVDETVTTEKLCIAPNGYIYLCVTGETFSALYELATNGTWTELCYKRGVKFSDVQVLAVIDPITELLVVERGRGYIWLLSIRESSVCARNMIAAVEKPGALCIDERHHLFIHDLGQSKIRYVESHVFEPIQDVALAPKNLTSITAYQGLIVAVYCSDKNIRIHRYSVA